MLDVKKLLTKILVDIAKPPYVWRISSRAITQNSGKNYWTMPETMDTKPGYTRIPIAYVTSNGNIGLLGSTLTSSNTVQVQTYNYASSSQSTTIVCLFLWVRDDLMVT